jgi:hypothetical protein
LPDGINAIAGAEDGNGFRREKRFEIVLTHGFETAVMRRLSNK